MGKRGPKPSPTALLKLRGSWRGETREGEPVPPVVEVAAPAWLSEKAAAHWSGIASMLAGLGLMAEVYSPALALMVDALADYIAHSEAAKVEPSVLVSPAGVSYINPVYTLKERAWDRVLKIVREFGMTPSAITSVKSAKSEKPKAGLSAFTLRREG